MTTRAAMTAMAIHRPSDTVTSFQGLSSMRTARARRERATVTKRTSGGSRDQLIHLLAAYALRDDRGDAVILHRDSVERVSDFHRGFLVRDDEQLRLLPQLFEQADQAAQVDVVQRRPPPRP